jgi:phosphate transport system substrate-binding protein
MISFGSTRRALLAGVAMSMLAVACGSTNTAGGTSPTPVDVGSGALTGAGSTFDQPLFSKAFFDYTAKYPQVTVNYQAVGSGAGIQQVIKKTVDFGATDVPMGSADITSAGGASTLTQIPITLGAVAIAFNVSGVSSLQLDGPTLAGIYLGQIKKWNDPAITALNSGVTLPSTNITVVHRSDGSGTTFIFTDYLSKVSPTWSSSVGTSKSVKWPVGIGASGTQAVAQAITSTEGAIGYVELAYAVQTSMHSASLKNANGMFVQPSVAGATAAAAQNSNVSPTNASITNEPGDTTYPIAGFSWVVLYTSYTDTAKGRAVVLLFKWLVTDGQSEGASLQYAPLPSAVQQLALTNLKTIMVGGSPVVS